MKREKLVAVTVIVTVLCVVLVVALYPGVQRYLTHRAIHQIVSADTTEQEKIEALKPYVAVGDRYTGVARRLGDGTNTRFPTKRPTEHQIGSLMLAIRTDGVITGIGTALPGEGEQWLIRPEKWWDEDTPLQHRAL